ncbi:MAG: hypothetical protein EZS28_040342, partial [Streblomastix strix]
PQTEDVLSKSSREKFKAMKTGRAVLPRFSGQGYSFLSNFRNSFIAKKGKFDQSRQNQFKGKGNYSAKKFGKFNKNRFNNTQDEVKPSRLGKTFSNYIHFSSKILKQKAIEEICNLQVAQQSQRYIYESLEVTLAYDHGSYGEDQFRKRSEYSVEYGQRSSRIGSESKQLNDRDQGSLKNIQQEQDLDVSEIHKTVQGSELGQLSQLVEGSSKIGNRSNGINGSQQGQSKQFIDKQMGKLKIKSIIADIKPVAFVIMRVYNRRPPGPFPRRMEEVQS